MEKGFRLHKKRTGQWICLAGASLVFVAGATELVSANEKAWVARTVEMVKIDLKESKDSTTYLIKWGDTLSVIAKAVDIDMNILAQINKIANVDLIYAGNKLSISKDGQRIVVDNGEVAQAYRVIQPTATDSEEVPEARVEHVAEFNSKNTEEIRDFINKNQVDIVTSTKTHNDANKPAELPDKLTVETGENLSGLVKNDTSVVVLPSIREEILSETSREETIEVPTSEVSTQPKTDTPSEPVSSSGVTESASEVSSPNVDKLASEAIDSVSGDSSHGISSENVEVVSDQANGETSFRSVPIIERNISPATENSSQPIASTVTVVERVVRLTEGVPYQVIYQEDENLSVGQTIIVTEGSLGEKISMQKVVIKDGVEVSRETTSINEIKAPVNRVIKVGTKRAVNTSIVVTPENETEAASIVVNPLPIRETIYTEVTDSAKKDVVTDDKVLDEMVKNVKNSVSIPTMSSDKLATAKLVEIYDNTIFEGRRELENIQASFVTVTIKRKRELQDKEDQVETLISKDIPVITGIVRVGTRKPGFETVKADGGLVSLSSDLPKEELAKIQVFDNKETVLSDRMSGHLGSAITLEYKGDLAKTDIGLEIKANNLTVRSQPSIYKYNEKTQLLDELSTTVNGNMAYAPISESGTYIVADKTEQDKTVQNAPLLESKKTVKTGRSIAFVLDSSGSMSSNDSEDKRISLSKELINQLDSSKDKVAVIDFDDYGTVLKNLGSNFDEAKDALEKVDSSGGTDLLLGLHTGLHELLTDKSNNKKSIVFLTDGEDNSRISQYDELLKQANDNNISIYVVGLRSVDEVLLREIANRTNGKYYYAEEANGLPEIFKQVEVDTIAGDTNNDRISAYYTKEIFKGNLLSGTGEQLFKSQVEEFRSELANKHGITNYDKLSEDKKKELLNPLIDKMDDSVFENVLDKDPDGDTLVNGNEARPEINKKTGKVYLYLVSHPNQKDTDGDGITDDKDNTPRGSLEKNLAIYSNSDDTDGDGWSDADENREKDSFGQKLNPSEWNVDRRDLAIFAALAYFDKNQKITLQDIFNNPSILNQKNGKDFGNDNLYGLLKSEDFEIFKKWELVAELESEAVDIITTKSNLVIFKNKNTKDIVLAFRGTDEAPQELVKDLTIPLGNKSFADSVEKLLEYSKIYLNDNYRNVYITGHSLGGYQAYIAASKLFGNSEHKVIRVTNLNGPGLPDWSIKNANDAYNSVNDIVNLPAKEIIELRSVANPFISRIKKVSDTLFNVYSLANRLVNKNYFDNLYNVLQQNASKIVSLVTDAKKYQNDTKKDTNLLNLSAESMESGRKSGSVLASWIGLGNGFWRNTIENIGGLTSVFTNVPTNFVSNSIGNKVNEILGNMSDAIWGKGTKHPTNSQKYSVRYAKKFSSEDYGFVTNALYSHYLPSFFASKDFNQGKRSSTDLF
ncbi:hypothetical protein STRDD10_01969 [Streptococcus sp. DD10]|uniref:VWA domain-containing protein n=1 Tax=Streptococcus sp. DD10 TaxID=1777878 RepID=UPI00079B1B04|nr:VWA domain-containing protein [Streptococcus sp. DD10]KXT72375.1 hypothetical protein STRDD10_01969 [Streptococcus sp. DD10]